MLSVETVSAGYGESLALSGVTLRVEPGQVACLMGRNGVGKTTLLKTVMGLIPARHGRIRFGEQDLTTAAPHHRAAAGIGYVPQGRGIFPYLTVSENLLMGLEAAPALRKRAKAQLDEMHALFPVLGEMARRIAGTLSGGQQQQLAIARALIRKPTLLLLDEPTEGIQPSIIEEIEELIKSLRRQRTMGVLLVEQFLDFALAVGDYCYVMEKGAIVSQGPAAQLGQDVVREHLSV
jgi:urea transport system ATP-binding protein